VSAAERPWWASGTDGDGIDREDPLAAHRAGRAGGSSAGERGADGARRDRAGHAHAHGHEHGTVDACSVCPVCAGIRILGEARPELVTHLSEAARHLTLAAKAFIDAQAEVLRRDEGLQRIDLDEE
jgi:hypothetical protein